MRHLVADLERIPGVVAVTLGGSRATGTATERSDRDLGLYYRGGIDTDAIRSLGWDGRVFEPGDWGRIDPAAAVDHVADLLAVDWV